MRESWDIISLECPGAGCPDRLPADFADILNSDGCFLLCMMSHGLSSESFNTMNQYFKTIQYLKPMRTEFVSYS
jgi:hypothetical protein